MRYDINKEILPLLSPGYCIFPYPKNIIRNCLNLIILLFLLLTFSCTQNGHVARSESITPQVQIENLPPQPGEDSWHFIEDLKAPMWTHHPWKKIRLEKNCADLSGGVKLKAGFTDPGNLLDTAYDDLKCFLTAGGVSDKSGEFIIETAFAPGLEGEAFRLEIEPKVCRILSSGTEGIRRGIFHFEDEMLRRDGPYLPLGSVERRPIIQRRISRCFFGPIKRPPKMRDELMDDVDYYPEQYLNRLAHDGVNGLWLTIEFRDLCSTSFTPDEGKDAAKRLAKLKRTVASCLRYGIRTYIFSIEPRAWDLNSPVLKKYPELGGAIIGDKKCFCPFSESAQNYLYESVNKIFKSVPDLGGMINISHGERPTTCLSVLSSTETGHIDCPRCSDKAPYEILAASLSAMEKGMHDAAPDAELMSWLYMPQPQMFSTGDPYSLAEWVYGIPAHTPKGVILQFNFESGVKRIEFGKELVGGDYWISNPGPSSRFERIAETAKKNKTSIAAKIQTGCSHEVATVPYVPVPSLLYRKFSEMRRLGVSHVMLCWYFGNYPGLMNKVASELTFEPFPKDEDTFLQRLASIYCKKKDVSKIVEAWKYFSKGYENYPLTNMFQYYGPMHDGPVWPLLLKPADTPLSPTWQIGSSITRTSWPPSGDRIGECLGDVLTLRETTELARRMSTSWDKGVAILSELEPQYGDEPERISDIGIAKALGIQFRSGYNILRFYLLREEMLRMDGSKRLQILNQLCEIIREEIELDKKLLVLCENDSRLGFHSEAEGYKYFPEKINWRMDQLRKILTYDAPEIESIIRKGNALFPEYTSKNPTGPAASCKPLRDSLLTDKVKIDSLDLQWQKCGNNQEGQTMRWAACYDREALYIIVSDSVKTDQTSSISPVSNILVKVEPFRLWPCKRFRFYPGNQEHPGEGVHIVKGSGVYYIAVRIPIERIGQNVKNLQPVRMNLHLQKREGATFDWIPNNPLTSRLILGSDNSKDLGWLLFQK
jgi:hypothetical protein